jgi:RNA polymerase sigma-70 factor (ECF subfamily)
MDLASLYAQEADAVFSFFSRSGLKPTEAEDATHDTFVTAMQRVHSFDPTRAIRPWLLGIAFRIAVARMRNARRREEPTDVAGLHALPDLSRDPEQSTAQRQAEALLRAALQKLPDEQRSVFILHELHEVGMNDIAETLGCSPNTAWSRLRLARVAFNSAIERLTRARAS